MDSVKQMTFGSLFSGIGGFDLGLERAGMKCLWQCEKDPYALKVLEKHWPNVRRYDDITTLDATALAPVDLICGGFPCQPFSVAGKRKGAGDDRFLWPAMLKVIEIVRPTWVLGENVPGLISLGLDGVLSDLEGLGYAVRAFVVPACAVGASHRRDRLWIVAHAESYGCWQGRESSDVRQKDGELPRESCWTGFLPHSVSLRELQSEGLQQDEWGRPSNGGQNVSNSKRIRCNGVEQADSFGAPGQAAASEVEHSSFTDGGTRWIPEPNVGRVAYGVSRRVDRLKCLGNAVVPAVVEEFGRMIVAANEAFYG